MANGVCTIRAPVCACVFSNSKLNLLFNELNVDIRWIWLMRAAVWVLCFSNNRSIL